MGRGKKKTSERAAPLQPRTRVRGAGEITLPLERIPFQTYNRDVHGILSVAGLDTNGLPMEDSLNSMDLGAPYQRGSVWTEEQRRNLIRSCLQWIPIGGIYLNSKGIMEPTTVVDGKQRIETLIAFVKSEFSIPAEWFADSKIALDNPEVKQRVEETGELYFKDLNPEGKRMVTMTPVATHETNFKTAAEEEDLYYLINYGGTPHPELDEAAERTETAPPEGQYSSATSQLNERERAFLCAFDEAGGTGDAITILHHPSITVEDPHGKAPREERATLTEIKKAFQKFRRLELVEPISYKEGGEKVTYYQLGSAGSDVLRDIRGDEGYHVAGQMVPHDLGRISRLLGVGAEGDN